MAVIKLIYITMIGCFLSNVNGQRTATIAYIAPEQIKDIGSQVYLVCSVLYADEYPVIWVKYDRLNNTESIPLTFNSGLIIRDSRFSLRYEVATGAYTLSIKDIQENDAGWYQCQVLISINNKMTAEVELKVRRLPIISDNSTRSIVASEGERNLSAGNVESCTSPDCFNKQPQTGNPSTPVSAAEILAQSSNVTLGNEAGLTKQPSVKTPTTSDVTASVPDKETNIRIMIREEMQNAMKDFKICSKEALIEKINEFQQTLLNFNIQLETMKSEINCL